jgi:hypothetical protein
MPPIPDYVHRYLVLANDHPAQVCHKALTEAKMKRAVPITKSFLDTSVRR